MGDRTVSEIRALFAAAAPGNLTDLIARYDSDERAGVARLVASARNILRAEDREHERLAALMSLQIALQTDGAGTIAGVDEVGRGALAGPVTAAAVVLSANTYIPRLDDSKRLSPEVRRSVAKAVRESAIAVSVAHIWPEKIDAVGIASANTLAMRSALDELSCAIDHVIADGLAVDLCRPATFVVGGDRSCACVAAASVVAKVERDAIMCDLDAQFPAYGFAVNKGYGTAEHIAAIERDGPSSLHRLSFSPCSQNRLF